MKSLDELERVSLALAVLGVITIFVASVMFEPPSVSLDTLDESFIGETVTVTGNVTDVYQADNTQFITLQGENQRITAVYFGNKDLGVIPYRNHQVEGEVDVYRGELEVIVRNIETSSASG